MTLRFRSRWDTRSMLLRPVSTVSRTCWTVHGCTRDDTTPHAGQPSSRTTGSERPADLGQCHEVNRRSGPMCREPPEGLATREDQQHHRCRLGPTPQERWRRQPEPSIRRIAPDASSHQLLTRRRQSEAGIRVPGCCPSLSPLRPDWSGVSATSQGVRQLSAQPRCPSFGYRNW